MPTADFLNEMSWSDRRRLEQRHFAAQKAASTEQLAADTPPAPAPVRPFRSVARVLTEAGIEHTVPSNGRIIHREVDR